MNCLQRRSIGVGLIVALMGCSSGSSESAGPTSPVARPASTDTDTDTVLVGTDVLPLANYPMQAIDDSWAGAYGVEMGGAEVSFTLRRAGDGWRFERLHREPGEPENRATGALELRDGSLHSPDGSVSIRGAEDGILVLELREDGPLPVDRWVLYFRD